MMSIVILTSGLTRQVFMNLIVLALSGEQL